MSRAGWRVKGCELWAHRRPPRGAIAPCCVEESPEEKPVAFGWGSGRKAAYRALLPEPPVWLQDRNQRSPQQTGEEQVCARAIGFCPWTPAPPAPRAPPPHGLTGAPSAPQEGPSEGMLRDPEAQHPQRGRQEDLEPERAADGAAVHPGAAREPAGRGAAGGAGFLLPPRPPPLAQLRPPPRGR